MLEFHFLNVGHGDSTIIRHPSGRLTMVDINNGQLLDADTLAGETATPPYAAPQNALNPFGQTGGLAGILTGSPNTLLGLTPGNGLFGLWPVPPNTLMHAGDSPVGLADAFAPWPTPPTYAGTSGGLASLMGKPSSWRSDLVDPIAYLDRYFPGSLLHRYIQTHPDLDHMRGLARLLQVQSIGEFWHPASNKGTPRFRGNGDREDWQVFQAVLSDKSKISKVISPAAIRPDQLTPGWPQVQGESIKVLSPTQQLVTWYNERGDSNNISYVLALDYAGQHIILGGDAEKMAWQHMVDRYGRALSCWVLKASHHGRNSGYYGPALEVLAPKCVLVSVGKKPDTDAHRKYKEQCADVRSTRRHGTIVLRVYPDGSNNVEYR